MDRSFSGLRGHRKLFKPPPSSSRRATPTRWGLRKMTPVDRHPWGLVGSGQPMGHCSPRGAGVGGSTCPQPARAWHFPAGPTLPLAGGRVGVEAPVLFLSHEHTEVINAAVSPDLETTEEQSKQRDELFISSESVLPNACKNKLGFPLKAGLSHLRGGTFGKHDAMGRGRRRPRAGDTSEERGVWARGRRRLCPGVAGPGTRGHVRADD